MRHRTQRRGRYLAAAPGLPRRTGGHRTNFVIARHYRASDSTGRTCADRPTRLQPRTRPRPRGAPDAALELTDRSRHLGSPAPRTTLFNPMTECAMPATGYGRFDMPRAGCRKTLELHNAEVMAGAQQGADDVRRASRRAFNAAGATRGAQILCVGADIPRRTRRAKSSTT